MLKTACAVLTLLLLAACASWQPPPAVPVNTYLLAADFEALPRRPAGELTLAVAPPRAAPGFDTPGMAYVQQPHALAYFAHSQWVDTPARMLAPLLVRALEQGGGFAAVLSGPGPVAGDLRLETEIIRLQQEFAASPSRVGLTLRARLLDPAARRVVKTRLFEISETAPSDDPYGGVIAANRATTRLLAELVEFCAVSPVLGP